MTRITARDLMLTNFVVVPAALSLEEALRALLGVLDDPAVPHALVVADADGSYRGLLTSRLLVRSLLALWMPDKSARDDERLDEELLEVVKERLRVPVRDALVRGIPVLAPDARLLAMIEATCDKRLEFAPVVVAGTAAGLVPVTAIFRATAALALTPGDEGIRFDQQR